MTGTINTRVTIFFSLKTRGNKPGNERLDIMRIPEIKLPNSLVSNKNKNNRNNMMIMSQILKYC
jgi:hypothetical protein